MSCGLLISCNKEYTCRCTDHLGEKQDYTYKATSRKIAKDDCETYDYTNGAVGGSCDLVH